jgi:DNA-binding response OmpR family regulator
MGDNRNMTTNKKVLVIDDDRAITELLSVVLGKHGFEVFTANKSEEGLQLITEKKPDIITLDLMMPDINGWDMCKKIRVFSVIPILVISAINDPQTIASMLDSGADDYIIKPLTNEILIAHLNTLLRRADRKESGQQSVNAKWLPGTAPL